MAQAPEQSRLERMIARLTTQRALLDGVAAQVAGVDGSILEIGLGKGRTYSHLRGLFPDREIWAFDFEVHAPAHSRPDESRILLGDFRDSLVTCWAEIEAPPALPARLSPARTQRDVSVAATITRPAARTPAAG